MRVSGNFYAGAKPAFGDNIGFLKAANELREDLNPDDVENMAAHAQDVEKTDEFMKEVNEILEDKKTIKGLKDLIKEYLNID